MNDVRIRDVLDTDAEVLAPLLEVLGYETSPAVLRDRLAAMRRSDPSGRVLAAFDEAGRAVGFLTLHQTPVLHRSTAVGRITALAVDPRAQGLGVGRRLVEEGERLCREAGLARIEVTSGVTHTAAYDFYRHLGYADQGLRFAKGL
jgi:ribosomal protein S18 acetylase RimI-like enzyme